jgi:hypothetical protein
MSLFIELRRRNVFRIAGIYAVVGWVLMQVAGTLEASLNLPEWFDSVITAGLLIGYPIALLLSWVFEMTPEGVKRTEDLPNDTESPAAENNAHLWSQTFDRKLTTENIFAVQGDMISAIA